MEVKKISGGNSEEEKCAGRSEVYYRNEMEVTRICEKES